MFHKQASRPLFWGLVAVGALSCVPARAQDVIKVAPIQQPSAFEAVDQAAKGNSYWSETGLGDDAKSLFVIDRDEARIQRRSERFEGVYLDLMKQQEDANAVIRTQDIPNIYNTSLLELQK